MSLVSSRRSSISSNNYGGSYADYLYCCDSDQENYSEEPEIPGYTEKAKLGPTSFKHHQANLNLTTDNGEARFLGSVKKELSKKSTIHKIQTAYQNSASDIGGGSCSTEFAKKTVFCTNQDISIHLSSPLDGITLPHYINNNQNPELVKDIPSQNLSDEEDNGSYADDDKDAVAKLAAKPSVLAVNLKWRPGITFKKCHKYSMKTTQLEPLMKKTELDYETKTKFENQMDSVCDELFPDWERKLTILNGNNCHYGYSSTNLASSSSSSSSGGKGNSTKGSKLARSERLQEEDSAAPSHKPDPFARQWKEYSDLDEHKILVIPNYSKNGFDMDLSTRYQLPYQAKFVIGRKTYHHKFMLQLPVTKVPQHYGLIFTFSEDPKGHSKIRIKSLLTVYCVHPVKPKAACLETYETNPDSEDYRDDAPNYGKRGSSSSKRNGGGAAGRAARNAVHLLTDNLNEDNLVSNPSWLGQFQMQKQLPQPGEDCYRNRRLYRNDYKPEGVKQKKKNEIKKSIKMEQAKF